MGKKSIQWETSVVLGTILAALTLYYEALKRNGDAPPAEVDDIATNGGSFEPLTTEQVDELAEALNFGELSIVSKDTMGMPEALRVLAQSVSRKQPTQAQVANVGQLIADALTIVNPDSSRQTRLARSLSAVIAATAQHVRDVPVQ